MRDIEYWDQVADGAASVDKNVVSFNPGKVQVIIHHLLGYEINKRTRILEIGIGRALIALALRNMTINLKYVATDLSYNFCQWGRRAVNKPVFQARIEDLPFKSNSFDYIFLFDVLEHIDPESRDVAYFEIGRVLDIHGNIFINNPCYESGHQAYDWGFSQSDIGRMAFNTMTLIQKAQLYRVTNLYSQFICLMR
jgi:ubiquinone/menaquinone biosynthesis C-methylase UbiE